MGSAAQQLDRQAHQIVEVDQVAARERPAVARDRRGDIGARRSAGAGAGALGLGDRAQERRGLALAEAERRHHQSRAVRIGRDAEIRAEPGARAVLAQDRQTQRMEGMDCNLAGRSRQQADEALAHLGGGPARERDRKANITLAAAIGCNRQHSPDRRKTQIFHRFLPLGACQPLQPIAPQRMFLYPLGTEIGGSLPRVKLTDRFVATVKADGRTDYFDAVTTGLVLGLPPAGAGRLGACSTLAARWQARPGRARCLSGRQLADARAKAIEAAGVAADGNDPRRTTKASARMTVADLVEAYVRDPGEGPPAHYRPDRATASA